MLKISWLINKIRFHLMPRHTTRPHFLAFPAIDVAIWLSLGQWNVGRNNMCHFQDQRTCNSPFSLVHDCWLNLNLQVILETTIWSWQSVYQLEYLWSRDPTTQDWTSHKRGMNLCCLEVKLMIFESLFAVNVNVI